jgi:Protein of unknown function (DUF3662)/FHA domain
VFIEIGRLGMVMGLARFERRLERAVEGAFARAFKSQVRPVELARRMLREMDLSVDVGVKGRRTAPNHFTIALSPEDVERFDGMLDVLALELAEEAEAHAADEGYALKGPAAVELQEDPDLRPGIIEVASEFRVGTRAPRPIAWLSDGTADRHPIIIGQPVVIGRMADCQIVVNDTNVSRRHAEVRGEGDHVLVLDLGSLNGTKVNGRGVPPEKGITARVGDEISVGSAQFTIVGSD